MPNDIVIREFYPHLTANATNPHITKADLAAMRQDLAQQNGWLAALCVLNALTLLAIIARIFARRATMTRLRTDDYLMIIAGVLVVCPHWVSAIASNLLFSEMYIWLNINDHIMNLEKIFWILHLGYIVICSLIKISMCYCILHIIPLSFQNLRIAMYLLAAAIAATCTAMIFSSLFGCQPLASNFLYNVQAESCVNWFAWAISWISISTLFDVFLIGIPLAILRLARLRLHERRALTVVFGANILGTVCILCRIYCVYRNQGILSRADAIYVHGTDVLLASLEMTAYTIGASMSVVSKKIVSMFGRTAVPEDSQDLECVRFSTSPQQDFSHYSASNSPNCSPD